MYIGLNIKENGIAYAVTDDNYKVKKVKQGDNIRLMGLYTLPAAKSAQDRGNLRRTRRRLGRQKFRKKFLRETLAKDVLAVDPDFYKRLDNTFFRSEDKPVEIREKNVIFNGTGFNDKDYYREYPTIHHLIDAIIKDTAPHDARLVFLALNYLMAHRGHTYMDITLKSGNDSRTENDVFTLWNRFADDCKNLLGLEFPDDSAERIMEIISSKNNIKNKKADILNLFADMCTDKDLTNQIEAIGTLLAGGSCAVNKLLLDDDYKSLKITLKSIDLSNPETTHEQELSKYFDIIEDAKNIYDYSIIQRLLKNCSNIAELKINIYNNHKRQLKELKELINKYQGDNKIYKEMFCVSDPAIPNYVSYIRAKGDTTYSCQYDSFAKYLNKILDSFANLSEEDSNRIEDIKSALKEGEYLLSPKNKINRLIPYQLVYQMVDAIINNAANYMPSLSFIDDSGLTGGERIREVFLFHTPYYIGPMVEKGKSEYSWLVKKENKPIRPWNYKDVIDIEATEINFINNLVGMCTYLKGEKVLPKESLLYQRFMVINALSMIKINGANITPEIMHLIYRELFVNQCISVTKKRIASFLIKSNIVPPDVNVSGMDNSIPNKLSSYNAFKSYIEGGIITNEDVENIIYHFTIFNTDTEKKTKWLKKNYCVLNDIQVKEISKMKFKDWGNISKKLLTEIRIDDDGNKVIDTMYNHALTLSQILSSKFQTLNNINQFNNEYYEKNPDKSHIANIIDEMYLNKEKRRCVHAAIAVVGDIVKATGKNPDKIYLYSSSEDTYNHIRELKARFANVTKAVEKNILLKKELAAIPSARLNNDKIYLYFMQQGKCAYTNEDIDFDTLLNDSENAYTVEHIYPKSKTMDNSIDNKLLIIKYADSDKGDCYPIPKEIKNRMGYIWKQWKEHKYITEEKYNRLIRDTPFTEEELVSFATKYINYDSSVGKVMKRLLMNRFGVNIIVKNINSEYVFDMANIMGYSANTSLSNEAYVKMAYLSIVAGNIADALYTSNMYSFINGGNKYTLNLRSLLEKRETNIISKNTVAWDVHNGPSIVQKELARNKIVRTYMSTYKNSGNNGGFYNTTLYKKGKSNLTPIKTDPRYDTEKYGGYSCKGLVGFAMVQARNKKDAVNTYCMPIPLYDYAKNKNDLKATANEVCKDEGLSFIKLIHEKLLKTGFRIKYDGYDMAVTGRTGAYITFKPLCCPSYNSTCKEYGEIVSRLHKKLTDLKKSSSMIISKDGNSIKETNVDYEITQYDKINKEKAKMLFYVIYEMLSTEPYKALNKKIYSYMEEIEPYWDNISDITQSSILALLIKGLNPDINEKITLKPYSGPWFNNIVSYNLDGHDVKIVNCSTIGTYTKEIEICK